jgi:hypothetical protein
MAGGGKSRTQSSPHSTESEQRAPTNIPENRIYFSYNSRIGRTLNSALQHSLLAPGLTAGELEPYLRRMQFDIVYSF